MTTLIISNDDSKISTLTNDYQNKDDNNNFKLSNNEILILLFIINLVIYLIPVSYKIYKFTFEYIENKYINKYNKKSSKTRNYKTYNYTIYDYGITRINIIYNTTIKNFYNDSMEYNKKSSKTINYKTYNYTIYNYYDITHINIIYNTTITNFYNDSMKYTYENNFLSDKLLKIYNYLYNKILNR